ncbi:hypothetical protein [Nonomuraea sp. NPDC050202]|uniref:hypothetical protein n=1 Tax=Nonomuraea sp. NPDC050202 TaxID=3155035 RepID=UPI0033C6CE26
MKVSELRGDHVFSIPVAGQATGGTADEFVALVAPFNMTITAVKWVPTAAITANGTNYFTLTLRNRGQAGAGTALAAQRSYASGNSSAFVGENMALSATAADLNAAAGDVLTVEKLTTGTGLAMPDGTVQIFARGN